MTIFAKTNFNLTESEQKVFDFLLQAAKANNLSVTLRAAGGWVRDKLIGIESHDYDIVIDTMTGRQFCEAIGLPVAVIAANPEQSKHLETACATVCGQPVDFCNLRDESFGDAYTGTDRILTQNRFGTALQDAERRDFTCNALFYNLHTGMIEDNVGGLLSLGYTLVEGAEDGGMQLQKIMSSIELKTPLDPKKTFKDDPLRVLRAFRFLSKLPNAYFCDGILDAISDVEVRKAFLKLSQERIAAELIGKRENGDGYKCGILSFRKGVTALSTMFRVGLLDLILDVPCMHQFAPFDVDQNSNWHKYDVFEHTVHVMNALWENDHFLSLPSDRQALLQFACLLHDLGKRDPSCKQTKSDGSNSYHGHEDSSANTARAICNKLMMSEADTTYVVDVVKNHMRPHAHGWGSDRVLRRFMHDLPDCWEDVLVHSRSDLIGTGRSEADLVESLVEYDRCLARGRELLIIDRDAPKTNKPIISGNVVMSLIPELSPKTGFIKDVNAALLEMRLERPETTEEEYLERILQMKPSLLESASSSFLRGKEVD